MMASFAYTLSWIKLVLPMVDFVFVAIGSIFLWKMWTWKSHYQLRPRTPKLLLYAGLGNLSVASLSCMQQVHGLPCMLGVLADYSLFSHVFIPYLLRALHYRIWHSDILRRRISWTLTSKFKLVFAVVFALIHYCIMLSCVVVSGTTSTRSPECLPGLDVYYLLALLVSFVSFTAYLVSRIPLRFDAFGIVTEFQLCLWCWSLLGGAALALLAISSHGYSIERELFSLTHSILQLIMNMASFYISIVRPTWEVRKLIIKQEFGANLLNRTHALYMTPELGKGTDRRKHYLHTGMMGLGGSYLSPKSSTDCPPGAVFGFESLESLFMDEVASQKLRDLAQARFMLENTEFLQAVHQYRMMSSDNLMELHRVYLSILDEYLRESSPYEVNINCKMRIAACSAEDISHYINLTCEGRKTIFDESAREIESLVLRNLVNPCSEGEDWRQAQPKKRTSINQMLSLGMGALSRKLSPSHTGHGEPYFFRPNRDRSNTCKIETNSVNPIHNLRSHTHRSIPTTGLQEEKSYSRRLSFSSLSKLIKRRRNSAPASPDILKNKIRMEGFGIDDSITTKKSLVNLTPRSSRFNSRVLAVGTQVNAVYPSPSPANVQDSSTHGGNGKHTSIIPPPQQSPSSNPPSPTPRESINFNPVTPRVGKNEEEKFSRPAHLNLLFTSKQSKPKAASPTQHSARLPELSGRESSASASKRRTPSCRGSICSLSSTAEKPRRSDLSLDLGIARSRNNSRSCDLNNDQLDSSNISPFRDSTDSDSQRKGRCFGDELEDMRKPEYSPTLRSTKSTRRRQRRKSKSLPQDTYRMDEENDDKGLKSRRNGDTKSLKSAFDQSEDSKSSRKYVVDSFGNTYPSNLSSKNMLRSSFVFRNSDNSPEQVHVDHKYVQARTTLFPQAPAPASRCKSDPSSPAYGTVQSTLSPSRLTNRAENTKHLKNQLGCESDDFSDANLDGSQECLLKFNEFNATIARPRTLLDLELGIPKNELGSITRVDSFNFSDSSMQSDSDSGNRKNELSPLSKKSDPNLSRSGKKYFPELFSPSRRTPSSKSRRRHGSSFFKKK